MERKKLKPGDKVWFVWERWCTVGNIVEGEVRFIDELNKSAAVKVPKASPRLIRLDLLFPTREALCEYYRKIFAPDNYFPINARVINEERLLYGEVVDIWASRVTYIDADNEHYEKEDLEFL